MFDSGHEVCRIPAGAGGIRHSVQAFINAINKRKLELISDIPCDFAADNFQPEQIIQSAIKENVNTIMMSPHVDKIHQAIKLAESNQGKLLLLGNPSLQTQKTLAAGNTVNGMIMAVPWQIGIVDNQEFIKNANHLWGKKKLITWRTAMAFDATKIVVNAIQKKGSTRTDIQQALSSNKFSFLGVTGTIKFLPWGDRIGNAVLVQIQPDPQAPTGYNFMEK